MGARMPVTSDNVFINCPFDKQYDRIRDSILFAIFDCGFVARCALEAGDSSEFRLKKILKIIADCGYSIHDISRTELDRKTRLPRFNMPLELGLFLGCRAFGGKEFEKKTSLIIDSSRYRYQKFISDIAGQDIRAHSNKPELAVRVVRDWLATESGRDYIPGGKEIFKRYQQFRRDLPAMCKAAKTSISQLTYRDYLVFVRDWLKVKVKTTRG